MRFFSPVSRTSHVTIFLFCVALCCYSVAGAAPSVYNVVLKKNGKILSGELLWEDEKSIRLKVDGVQMSFQKDQLDQKKMKELNAFGDDEKEAAPEAPPREIKETSLPLQEGKFQQKENKSPLNDLTETSKTSRTGKGPSFTEGDRPKSSAVYESNPTLDQSQVKAIHFRIESLEEKISDLEQDIRENANANRKPNQFLARELQDLRTEVERLRALLRQGHREVKNWNIEDRISDKKRELAYRQEQLKKALEEKSAVNVETLQMKISELKKEIAELESKIVR